MFLFIKTNNIFPSVLSNFTKQRNNLEFLNRQIPTQAATFPPICFQKFKVCVCVGLRERPPFTISQPVNLYSKSQANKGLEVTSGKEVSYYIKIEISSKTRHMKEHNQLFKIYKKSIFLGLCQYLKVKRQTLFRGLFQEITRYFLNT